ncbi:MAG: M23 family metallopeptidase [Acidimicrobiales bacterium]
MSISFPLPRALSAAVLVVAVSFSSMAPVAARGGPKTPVDDELPPPTGLLAPFACGTEWQGSTYAGHGSNNWNLDLNQVGDTGTDLGQPILAQGDGVVVWFKQTGYNNHAGTYIEIDYGDITVRYIHLVESSIPEHLAEIGAAVTTGEVIGLLGATGRVTGPHLHLEYWDSAEFEDSAWYQLPRSNHIPVVLEGQELVATPGHPSPAVVSTNCGAPTVSQRWSEVRLWRHAKLDAI